jgi:hypothetical protein
VKSKQRGGGRYTPPSPRRNDDRRARIPVTRRVFEENVRLKQEVADLTERLLSNQGNAELVNRAR